MIRHVASYALFSHPLGGSWKPDAAVGKLSTYIRFLPTVIRAHHALWRGWEFRLHHDANVTEHPYYPSLRRMQDAGLVTLVHCGEAYQVGYAPMWRFKPAFDGLDRVIVSCDVDSLPLLSLRMAVEDFIRSDHGIMVVHGCETHNTVMAGLVAFRGVRLRELTGSTNFEHFMSLKRFGWNSYGADELYLRDVIWPRMQHQAMLVRLGGDRPSLITCADVRRTWSSPVPPDLLPAAVKLGNAFSPYPGAAGFEIERALRFYSSLPQPEIAAIAACEDIRPELVSGLEEPEPPPEEIPATDPAPGEPSPEGA